MDSKFLIFGSKLCSRKITKSFRWLPISIRVVTIAICAPSCKQGHTQVYKFTLICGSCLETSFGDCFLSLCSQLHYPLNWPSWKPQISSPQSLLPPPPMSEVFQVLPIVFTKQISLFVSFVNSMTVSYLVFLPPVSPLSSCFSSLMLYRDLFTREPPVAHPCPQIRIQPP